MHSMLGSILLNEVLRHMLMLFLILLFTFLITTFQATYEVHDIGNYAFLVQPVYQHERPDLPSLDTPC
jgi:hypothetical protein